MGLSIFQFIISALVIVAAGIFLTRFSDKIADLTGWGKMFVGGLLLAGATSLPELVVDLNSVQMNLPDMAVGDLLGSSLFNLLILATLDFSFPSAFRHTAFSPAFLHHSLSAVLTIILTAVVGIGIISQLETSFFGVSIFAWLVVIMYVLGLILINREENGRENKTLDPGQRVLSKESKHRSILYAFLGYLVSALVILIAAPYLVRAADNLANQSGLGHTFIGTTLVALATSLPELVSTLAAFRMGSPDLALGNIFGSNAFNMILFFPLDLMYPGPLFGSVRSTHAVTAFGVITAMSVAVMGQLHRKKERSRFTEPSSEIVFIVIVLTLFLLYRLKL